MVGLVLGVSVGAGAQTGDAYKKRVANMSSHSPAFFKELLTGRVWIKNVTDSPKERDKYSYSARYFKPDGLMLHCLWWKGDHVGITSQWHVVRSQRYRAVFGYVRLGGTFDPKGRKGHTPMFYNAETGELNSERWISKRKRWFKTKTGWVQESWPRVLKEACPDLDLPADLAINEKQTSLAFRAMRGQDPDAPLRNFPGSELAGPGATGIGASQMWPTMTAGALKDFLLARNSEVLLTNSGTRLVLMLNPARDELWRLDGGDGIVDIGYLVSSDKGKKVTLQFEKSNKAQHYWVGYPLPLLPTGERYAAMRMMDWIIARGEDVVLPFLEREQVAFAFAEGGQVVARTTDGEDAPGKWWWSRGRLHISLESIERSNAYLWDELAGHVGWTPEQ